MCVCEMEGLTADSAESSECEGGGAQTLRLGADEDVVVLSRKASTFFFTPLWGPARIEETFRMFRMFPCSELTDVDFLLCSPRPPHRRAEQRSR